MAKDGLGTIITLGIVGVGGWWLYSSGMLSSLFGSAPATTPKITPTNPPPAGGTNPVPSPPPTTNTAPAAATWPTSPPYPLGPSGPCAPGGVLASILTLAQKANPSMNLGPSGTDTFTMDQWNYYANQQCSGLATQAGLEPTAIFPGDDTRGGPLNWNAWAGYAKGQGLSSYRGLGARRRRRGVTMLGTHPVRRVA